MKTPETLELTYKIYNREGRLMESRPASLRYPPEIERSMMEAGYSIKINGRKITKKEIMKK